MVSPPLLDLPVLDDLAEGFPGDLEPHAELDRLRFDGLEFDGVDLTSAVVSESVLERVSLVDNQWRGIRIVESLITGLNAPVLPAARSHWRDVGITQSRIGSAELFDSQLQGVRITGSKLGYLNLRGATLTNVLVESCAIDELDLGGARLTRVAFRDCQLGTLDVTRATNKDTDLRTTSFSRVLGLEGLRGATVDEFQLAELSGALAEHLGIDVE